MVTRRTPKAVGDENWCPIEATLGVIGGVWKVIIIRELLNETKRYSQLHRAIGGVTHKMLAQQLRELERDGVLHREVYKQIPPKVEYSLTEFGARPVLQAMNGWGLAQLKTAADRNASKALTESDAAEQLAVVGS